MGIASWALGADNPFSQYVADNRQTVKGAFAGFGQGTNFGAGLGNAAMGAQRGALLDDVTRADTEAEKQRVAQINQTAAFLREKGAEDLAAAVEGGMTTGADAFNQWYQQANAQPDLTADMQNYQYAQANPGFADFMGGAGEAPQIVETFDAETGQPVKGYMQGTTFVPVGGPKQASARDNPMNATIQQAILGADEVAASSETSITTLNRALELSQQAYEGPASEQRAAVAALFGDQGAQATLELKNIVMSNALESLKATFGAAPTEGERKILLDIQGSVDQPKAVREAIYRRAQAAAARRVELNRRKAEALRSGQYFDPGYGQEQAAPNTTSTGLQWSIEP